MLVDDEWHWNLQFVRDLQPSPIQQYFGRAFTAHSHVYCALLVVVNHDRNPDVQVSNDAREPAAVFELDLFVIVIEF